MAEYVTSFVMYASSTLFEWSLLGVNVGARSPWSGRLKNFELFPVSASQHGTLDGKDNGKLKVSAAGVRCDGQKG